LTELTPLEGADEYCRQLAQRHYENFTVVSRFLPGRLGLDLTRVYAFCRTTDDLGDESGTAALARLARWRDEVGACFAGEPAVHPVLVALHETVAHHELPAQPFLDLIAANVQDQHVTSYESWPDLRAYCLLSAAPVGRMVLSVFELRDARAEQLSDDVCIGLQLANHAQDVQRDAVLGRCYLLQKDLRSGGLVSAVQALSARARDLLQSGRELEAMVPYPLRVQLALYRLGGLAIVGGIQRIGYRTDIRRPEVSKAAKATLLLRALLESMHDDRHATKLQAV
jgi:squalene synthase HpnC